MEVSTETWPLKNCKKNEKGDGIFAKEDEFTRWWKKEPSFTLWCKKSRQRSSRNPSLQSLATSLNEDCCLCVGAFATYMKAVFKCLYSAAFCQFPFMDFEKLFCEWLEATGDACHDLYYMIRKLFKSVIGR